jgi:FemAB-related protein (PEP-CTERM system-associated)
VVGPAIAVRPLAPEDRAAWDAFVDGHPQGTPFHLLAWKSTLETSFGYEPRYLAAVDGAGIRAVLPLFLIRNPISGRVLLSTPFAVYGGVLADSPDAAAAMKAKIADLARELRVEHVELRNAFPEQRLGFEPLSRYVTFTQETAIADPEELLAALPKKTRNMVRKTLKLPYESREARDLKRFYDLLSRNYRRLGTPVFPRRYFETLLRNFGKLAEAREILLDGKVVAASISFLHRGEMHTYYAASDQEYLHAAPNNYMYFEHLLRAARNGLRRFDFGRSKLNTGTFEFKRHWLTEMRELPYEVLLERRKELPNITPANPKFDLALRIWRRLPLFVTRLAGPPLVRLFP